MPCAGCLKMLEGGVQALWEITEFSPEELPPLPPKFESWKELQQYLVGVVGHLRVQERAKAE